MKVRKTAPVSTVTASPAYCQLSLDSYDRLTVLLSTLRGRSALVMAAFEQADTDVTDEMLHGVLDTCQAFAEGAGEIRDMLDRAPRVVG